MADRATRPFTGVATTAAGAGLAVVLTSLRDPWVVVDGAYAALGGAAWLLPVGWWPLRDGEPDARRPLGGAPLALPPAAPLAAAPLAASDSLGLVVWAVLTVAGALTCLAGVGAVAVVRSTRAPRTG
ncbi:hypothetical protein ACFEMC_22610 [Kineococcus sp. DHX-1]|uniref:hypothetical protein n=1 Tax=Kineococcus sp. DHX-1 TaxID=3349638 RepID=UPI0036D3B6CF